MPPGGTLTHRIPHGPFPSTTASRGNAVAAVGLGKVKNTIPGPQGRLTEERPEAVAGRGPGQLLPRTLVQPRRPTGGGDQSARV